ncbi:MAG: hypothetical protein EBQ92_01035, partial [Proteobacteria bacterium]|nr:hypothetical protein [Pseudomonadota bacterium]
MSLPYSFAICAFVLFQLPARAGHYAFKREPLLKTSTIESWFQDPSKEPKTVEELLSRFPDVYRSHFSLMYESQSLHRATPDYPRIIFFGPDARLMAGISTDPEDPRRNVVEMIEFEPGPAKYSFHEIEFGNARPKYTHAPARCQNCHGNDGRPNWEPYDAWPGAYGSVHDTMAWKTYENSLFTNFLTTYLQEPRFQSLPKSFVMTQQTLGGDPTYYTASRGEGLNSAFSLLVSFGNRERLARIMVQSKAHARYRYAITAALIGCVNPIASFLPADLRANHPRSFDEVLTETRNLMEKDLERRVARTAKLQKIEDLETFASQIDRYGLREKEIIRTAKLRYLFENRSNGKILMDRWPLSLYRDSYNFND